VSVLTRRTDRKSRFTDEQIIAVLHKWEAGAKIFDLARRHGVTEQTLYRVGAVASAGRTAIVTESLWTSGPRQMIEGVTVDDDMGWSPK